MPNSPFDCLDPDAPEVLERARKPITTQQEREQLLRAILGAAFTAGAWLAADVPRELLFGGKDGHMPNKLLTVAAQEQCNQLFAIFQKSLEVGSVEGARTWFEEHGGL